MKVVVLFPWPAWLVGSQGISLRVSLDELTRAGPAPIFSAAREGNYIELVGKPPASQVEGNMRDIFTSNSQCGEAVMRGLAGGCP